MDLLLHQYIKNHPQQAARVLETCSVEEFLHFSQESNVEIGAVLPYISSSYLSKLLESGETTEIIDIVRTLPDMQVATLLKHVSEAKRASVLSKITGPRLTTIQRLIEFNETQVGFYVQKPKVVLVENNTISQALAFMDALSENELPIFVVNVQYQLLGTLNLVKLIQRRGDLEQKLLHSFSSKILTISASSPIESIKRHKAWQQYKSIAIIGRDNHFLGIISKDILRQKMVTPLKEQSKSSVEEYFFFSEMIWNGLNKFWGGLK